MVYAPGADRQLKLVAVEYVIPIAAWQAAGNTEPLSVLGEEFSNPALGLYILHAWVWQGYSSGMLEDRNGRVACP